MAERRIRLSSRSSSNNTRIGFFASGFSVMMPNIRSFRRALSRFRSVPYRPRQLGQLGKHGHAAPPLLMVKRRRAADHRSRLDIAMGPALRGHDYTVADFAMPCHAHLTAEDHTIAQLGRTRETELIALHEFLSRASNATDLHVDNERRFT